MKTMHLHHSGILHESRRHFFMSRLIHVLSEPFFWISIVLALLILSVVLLSIYGASPHLRMQFPLYYP